MNELDADESLAVNKVEEGIRCAADAGAVMIGVLIDGKELSAREARSDGTRNHHLLD